SMRATKLGNAERTAGIACRKVGDDGFPRDRDLAFRDQRPHACRQIDVNARAETDHADALARTDVLALAHERHDAPRDEAPDLHHADAPARAGDDEAVAFVFLARLVEVGVDELA